MGIVEIDVIASQVQLDIEVVTVYRLVRLSCCGHVQLQQGMSVSITLRHDASHVGVCVVVEWFGLVAEWKVSMTE